MSDDAEAIEDAYNALIERAVKIAKGAPFDAYLAERDAERARLFINGETASLYWPQAISDWDCATVSDKSVTFPTALLHLDDKALTAFQKAAEEKQARAWADQRALRLAEAEAEQRAQYEALKRKFG